MNAAFSFSVVVTFVASIACQVFALSVMPSTEGFTKFGPTAICLVAFGVGLALLARILSSGVPVGILVPLSSASVPIGVILVGALFLGEPASLLRLALLIGASVIIGVASSV